MRSRGLSNWIGGIGVAAALCGCRLVDQTSFDPTLRARLAEPKAAASVVTAPETGPKPLIVIGFTRTPDYEAALRQAVRLAISRKPEVQFNVVTVVPALGSIDDQIAAVQAVGDDARRVASSIIQDGVDPGQVTLGAQADTRMSGHEVRVYVH